MTSTKVATAVEEMLRLLGNVTPRRYLDVDRVPERDEHIAHLAWMCPMIVSLFNVGRLAKAMRWLGYVQGAIVAMGIAPIGAMKTMLKPDDGSPETPLPPGEEPAETSAEGL